MNTIVTIAIKDLKLLVRDRAGFFFTFIFPLFFAIFFGLMFASGGGGPGKIDVVVVDQDQSPGSQRFVKSLLEASEFDVTETSSEEIARKLVLSKKAAACVVVPPGFGAATAALFFGSAELRVGADPSRAAETGMLMGILQKYAFMDFSQSMSNPATARQRMGAAKNMAALSNDARMSTFFGQMDTAFGTLDRPNSPGDSKASTAQSDPAAAEPGATLSLVEIKSFDLLPERQGPKNAFAISFPQGIVWGIMGSAMGFAMSLVGEKIKGTLARLRVSPHSTTHLLLGKSLACFVATAGVCAVMLVVAMLPPFNVHVRSPLMLIAAVACSCFAFVGIMMIVAAYGKTERAANGFGWGAMMIAAFVGGAAMPLAFLPTWIQPVSNFSPMKWTILALECGIWRDAGWATAGGACAVLLAIGTAGFAAGSVMYKRGAAAA